MAKPGTRSTETKNVAGNVGGGAQQTSTHPTTRVIDPGHAGERGSVRATPVPMTTIASIESRAQKPQRPQVPVSVENIPVTPAESAKSPKTEASNP